MKGEDVVQLYLSNTGSKLWQPEKELKDFQRVLVNPGQRKKVNFTLDIEDFYYFDESKGQYSVEEGNYVIRVGNSSDNLPLERKINLNKEHEKSDLRLVNIYTYPRYPEKGDRILLLATIKNYGIKATSSDNIITKWMIDGKEAAISKCLGEKLAPGEMRLICCDTGIDFFDNWVAGGNKISVTVDSENNETEYFEHNNSKDKYISF